MRQDHEEYRQSKEAREQRSIATELELRRQIERLEEERARMFGESQIRDTVLENRGGQSRSVRMEMEVSSQQQQRSPRESQYARSP